MKQALISVFVSVIFLSPNLSAVGWETIAAQVSKSIMYLTGPEGKCTAFTIDAQRDYVLTAGHCEQLSAGVSVMRVGGLLSSVTFKDEKKDLMVLHVPGDDHPAIKLAADNPKIGEQVASYGYGYALGRPLFRVSHVSDDSFTAGEAGIDGIFLVFDSTFIGGMSGGPVFNILGEVVAIVQMGSPEMGIGTGAEEIRKRAGKYFEKN